MGIFTNHKVAAQNKVRQEAARLSLARSGWVRRHCPIRGAFEACENSSVDTHAEQHMCPDLSLAPQEAAIQVSTGG